MPGRNQIGEGIPGFSIEEEVLKFELLIKKLEKLTIKELAERGTELKAETDIIKDIIKTKRLIAIYEEKGFKGVYDWFVQEELIEF